MSTPRNKRTRELDFGGWIVFLAPFASIALVLALLFGPRCDAPTTPGPPAIAAPPPGDGTLR
jgi:hypothetical protein